MDAIKSLSNTWPFDVTLSPIGLLRSLLCRHSEALASVTSAATLEIQIAAE
jgi:hypothetical protein